MPRALILAEQDLGAWSQRFADDLAPSPLPYGINALERHGYRLRGVTRTSNRYAAKVRDVFEHRLGFPIEQALRGLGLAGEADVVIALLEHQGALAGLLKRRGLSAYSATPLVIWSCWLADDLRRATPSARERLRQRYGSADLITHMSRHETDLLLDLGVPESRLATLDFGIDHHFYTPADVERDIELLSVGQDRGRDFATLIDAVRGTDLRLDLVCKPDNVRGLSIPDNVTLQAPVSLRAYRDLLRRAQVVAVPTFDLAYPTGQSVALEAASVGACIAVTNTRAMADYVTPQTGRLVDVGDVEGWRQTLLDLRSDQDAKARLGAAARESVLTRFNADRMWAQFASILSDRGIV